MKKERPSATKEAVGKKPRVGELIELSIATLDEDGYGIGRAGDFPVLVTGVLPGETVRARIVHAGRRELFAATVKVLRHSPVRLQSPPCAKAAVCDGCPLVQMKYPAQLDWKRALVADALYGYLSLQGVTPHPVLPSPKPLHYRSSAKLVIAGKFSAPVIGIYRRNSHEVLDIGDCPLHHPLINRVVAAVKEGIRKGKVPIYSPRSGTGLLRYLVVRVSETENRAMAVLVTAERNFNEIHHLAKHIQKAVPEVEVVAQNVNSSTGNVIFGEKDHFVTKQRVLGDAIGETRFVISPRSFFQVNSGGARLIYEKVREWGALTGRESVVDLYCGVGGISLFLAPHAREVVGIEVVEAAVADAEKNARLNGIRNCRFEAGGAAELLEELHEEGMRPALVVLNPPRKGCDEEVLRDAAGLTPAKIIYVSCSPQSLARDLDILARLGYRTREVQPVDMFPQTPHVENVALLVREDAQLS
jgi:23S rRNA (uracil1939-C5)-methyltransferase